MKLSLFTNVAATSIETVDVSWDDFCSQFSNPPTYASKAACQLFSLTEFGQMVNPNTDSGSLKHNANVVQTHGVLGDYDGEIIDPEVVVARLREANVRALVYTSASHTPTSKRFRIVAPFDTPQSAEVHKAAAEKLNSLVEGKLASESFASAQAYYVGKVADTAQYFQTWRVEGEDISKSSLPRVPWRGSKLADGSFSISNDTLLADLEAGEEVHQAITLLAARGYTQEHLEDLVNAWCPKWARPERGAVAIRDDIPRAVGSWERKRQRDLEKKLASAGAPPEYKLPPPPDAVAPTGRALVQAASLAKVARKRDWLIRNVFERRSVVIMFGDSQSGKTFTSIDWAGHVASGREWCGRKVQRAPVAYIAGEGHANISKRVMAWGIHNGVDLAGADLWVSERTIGITGEGAAIWEELDALPSAPGLIILDTLGSLAPAVKQNESEEVNGFFVWCKALADRYNATVIVVHHSGNTEKRRPKGSSDFMNGPDVVIGILNPKGLDDPKHPERTLFCSKQKDAELFDDLFFRFQSVPLPIMGEDDQGKPVNETSSVLVLVDKAGPPVAGVPPATGDAGTGSKPKAADIIHRLLSTPGRGEWTKQDLRDEFKREWSDNPNSGAFQFNKAWKAGVEAGRFVYDEDNDTCRLFLG